MVRVVRRQRMMLDFDQAWLCGAPTSVLNQAVRRNADRVHDDFAYQLTQQEFSGLMSQIAISKSNHFPSFASTSSRESLAARFRR
jgi:hypothetical protein